MWATGGLTGGTVRGKRILLAAFLGGLYGLAAEIFGGFLRSLAVKGAIGSIVGFAALGSWGAAAVFLVASMALGGFVAAVWRSGAGVWVLFILGILLLRALKGAAAHRVRGELAPLTIWLKGRKVTLTTLRDTGNTLCDPVTGLPVTVCRKEAVLPLFDRETRNILCRFTDPGEALRRLGGPPFCLVPYRAVGGGGLLLAFYPDGSELSGRSEKMIIAITDELGRDERGYSALTQGG